nr:uncharacterized protein LOC116808578 [Taeniopygia guttata]
MEKIWQGLPSQQSPICSERTEPASLGGRERYTRSQITWQALAPDFQTNAHLLKDKPRRNCEEGLGCGDLGNRASAGAAGIPSQRQRTGTETWDQEQEKALLPVFLSPTREQRSGRVALVFSGLIWGPSPVSAEPAPPRFRAVVFVPGASDSRFRYTVTNTGLP